VLSLFWVLNKDEYHKRGTQVDKKLDFIKQIIPSNLVGLGCPFRRRI